MVNLMYHSMLATLEYVHAQAPGDKLKASIKDREMVRVYLSAGQLRKLAKMLNIIERSKHHGNT